MIQSDISMIQHNPKLAHVKPEALVKKKIFLTDIDQIVAIH
jgi:hypothetical protein